ncbi:hypothetical protein Hamer_G021744 [Homarus americanus]|uniref:Uncharacterized protein n=2 Tax=Homarus americanus TaxID=6706 RepID=A0A8J5MX50_HOMAM|nr:hypothetical protein Hamer_G021744 [Homarus americanus]
MEGVGVPFEVLWCQCQGNASATPHQVLIHEQMTKMHSDAQQHALWYVGVVLTLYLLGLVIIIRRSGRTERHTAVSALSFCFSRVVSSIARRSTRRRRERQQRERVMSPPSEPHRQQAAGPSLQLHLVAAKEEMVMDESCLTTVA